MGLHDFTFYDLIRRNAVSYKNRMAWFEADDRGTVTFSQYKEQVDRLAAGLRRDGVQKGDRIGVLGKNCLEFFLLYGAAAALGSIMVPINWRLSADEVAFNLNDCTPKVVFADQEHQDLIEGIKDKLPSVSKYYNLGTNGQFQHLDVLMDNLGIFDAPNVDTKDGYLIIHTAAVTGRPRGALLSHGNVMCADMHFAYFFNMHSEDVHLNILPLYHIGGLFVVTAAFHMGALNVNMSKFDAEHAVALIEEKKASVMVDFSPILSSILEAQEKTGKDIGSLKTVVGLETAETIEKYQKLLSGTFYSFYGQTETSCLASFGRYDDKPGSAGKMLPLAEVRIVDDYDRKVDTGEEGEIIMRGPMVFKGYWRLPEDNEYNFRGGWHHTGDIGRFDEKGYLFYVGRKADKDLIKPGGENVYPAEVERTILQHPAIEMTCVFGVPDAKWKEGIKAVCLLKEGERLNSKELTDFVGQRIARYKKPQYVEFITDFPLLEDGSPDREKIKDIYGGEQ